MGFKLADILDPQQADNLKAMSYELPTQEEQAVQKALGPDYSKIFSKEVAQGIVNDQAVPGKTAADSAKAFESLLGPAMEQEAAPAAASAISPALEEGAGSLFSKLASGLAAKGALGAIGDTALGAGARIASKVLGPIALATGIAGDLADPKDAKAQDIPGKPGFVAKGPDIVPKVDMDAEAAKAAVPMEAGAPQSAPPSGGQFQAPGGTGGQALGMGDLRTMDEPDLKKELAQFQPKMGMGDLLTQDEGPLKQMLAAIAANNPPPAPVSAVRSLAAGQNKPAASTDSAAPKATPLADLLKQSRDDMSAAQEAANKNTLYANLARAGGTLAHAIAGAPGHVDETGYNALLAGAQAPVTNLKEQQANQVQGIKMQELVTAAQLQQEKNDANSFPSKMARDFANKMGYPVPATATSAEIEGMLPHIQAVKLKELQVTAMLEARRMLDDYRTKSLGLRADQQAFNAGKAITNHPIVQQLTKQRNQIALDRHTLETTDILTPQLAAELSRGVANALGGGRSVGFHEVDMQQIKSSEGDFNKILQYWTGKPMNAMPAAQRKFLMDTLDRLDAGYSNALSKQVDTLSKTAIFAHNPLAQQTVQQVGADYKAQTKPAAAPASSGMVLMKDPQGNIRSVRADQVKGALAAGGTLVQQ